MLTVNIHEAKTHLSKLVDQAANGEAFVIAKAGMPMVKVVPLRQHRHRRRSTHRLHGGRDRGSRRLRPDGRRRDRSSVRTRQPVNLLLDTPLLLWAAG